MKMFKRRLTAEKNWLAGMALTAAVAAMSVFPAMAAGTVSSIRLNFKNIYEVGEIIEPEISCTTSGLSIESVEWSRDPADWKPGTKVTAAITLECDGSREFSSSYGASSCKIDGANFSSAKKDEDENLVVKASYYPVVQLDAPESAGWSGLDKTTASWSKVEYATGYQIRLYRDDSYIKTIEATGAKKDLTEYMTKEGFYYYEVRAVGKDTGDAKYRRSSEYTMSEDKVLDDLGDTDGRWSNYNEGKKFRKDDGTYAVSEWYKIQGKWYYFDETSFAVSGWRKVGGTWYYMDQDGVMLTGWQKVNGVWYYLNEDGSMAVGWKQTAPRQWYFLNSDGSMAANTVVDGYQLDASGLWVE